MSDDSPFTPEQLADPGLMRRVAWGIVAGGSQAEVAEDEGLTAAAMKAVLASSGMYRLLKVWSVFFMESNRGDIPLLTVLVRWSLDHVLRHAGERAVGAGVGHAFMARVFLNLSPAGTLKALCDHIEGVIGLRARKPLRGLRAKLVWTLCWVVEVALTQRMIDVHGPEILAEFEARFARSVLDGTVPERIFGEKSVDQNSAIERVDEGATSAEPLASASSPRSAPTQPSRSKPKSLHTPSWPSRRRCAWLERPLMSALAHAPPLHRRAMSSARGAGRQRHEPYHQVKRRRSWPPLTRPLPTERVASA